MQTPIDEQDRHDRVRLLVAIGVFSVLLWQTRIGAFALYPFTILATWFHEMGHGLAAMAAGAGFERLIIYSDGSGVAQLVLPADRFRVTDAIISAFGPLGPAIAGALLIAASRNARATRIALAVLGAALVASMLIWVRSLTGWLVLPPLGAIIAGIAWKGSGPVRQFAIQFLGVQAAISVWRQFDYLFSDAGIGPGELSDTAAIAQVLFLPYWIWGAIISAATVALLWWSFRLAFRR